jgi:hypothetical protein
MLAGEASPIISLADASTNTARMLAEFDERDPTILADLMMVENRALIEEVSSRPPDEPYPWHAGLQLTMTQASAVALGEFLVHGFDLARALRRPWSIEGRHALLVINGVAAILPAAVDPTHAEGFTASYELRLRGGAPFGMRFDHGALSIQPGAARRADCHISAEPAAFLLVSYGRVTPWRYVARGRLVAWGRRPWLAPRFGKMLHSF